MSLISWGLLADLTNDRIVTFEDFAGQAADWQETASQQPGDLNRDGIVDIADANLFAHCWLQRPVSITPHMLFIPSGTFEMGDNFGDGSLAELPVHTVTLDSFYMGKYEVTNGQYCNYLNSAILGGNIKVVDGIVYAFNDSRNDRPYCDTHSSSDSSQIDYSGGVFSVRTKSGRDMSNDPMAMVSWYGSVAYCNWWSQQVGKEQCYSLSTWNCDFGKHGYRLATEAEWEYAARGGSAGRRFPWGDTISHSQANYYSWWDEGSPHYPYDVNPTEGYHPTWDDGVIPYTSPVGSFSANGYDLFDMAANVYEWCNDRYDEDYYQNSPVENPTGPTRGGNRVIRGGSWGSRAYFCRVAYRISGGPEVHQYAYIGFRLVLDLN